jgi:hypothetical protein
VGLSDVPSGNLNTTQNTALVNAATKLQALISDRTDFAVLTPGSRENFTLLNALNALGAADIKAGPSASGAKPPASSRNSRSCIAQRNFTILPETNLARRVRVAGI